MNRIYNRLVPFFLSAGILLADILSKLLTHTYLPLINGYQLWYPYGGIGVFKNFLGIEFSLSHQINRGAAWGVLSDFQIPLLYLRIVLVFGLIAYALFFNKYKGWNIPLALIIAGAAGNILDYFLYGHVVDMLHFVFWGYDFPVFNLADCAIFIGVAWLSIITGIKKNHLTA